MNAAGFASKGPLMTRAGAADYGLPPSTHGYISDKDKYLKRMERIEGQARGISTAAAGGPESDAKLAEASEAIARLVRS